ncbi:hypothetical protein KI387_019923, partial [Taxus chinensis]
MAAEVICSGHLQFQNSFNSQRFECSLDQTTMNSHDIDFSSFVAGEQEDLPLQLPPLMSVKSENDDIGSNNIDDMFSVDMFDFGMNEQDSFAMFDNGDHSQECNHDGDGGMLINSPSKSMDKFVEENNNGCPPSSALVPANPLGELPQGLLRSDSDGLTDFEDQLAQQPALDQSDFPTSAEPTFTMAGPHFSQQNPFYNDIHFNWPQLNEMQ